MDRAQYPIVDGIPVFLQENVPHTMELVKKSIAYAKGELKDDIPHLYLQSVGVTDEERRGILELARRGNSPIDPVVSYLIGATNGIAYKNRIGKLNTYPIPDIPLPKANGESLLDIGCNWGRWSIAAYRKGYTVTGLDPSLGALAAGKRVCAALSAKVDFVCGDARFLPFENKSFDAVFSYSVLQHMSRENVALTLKEIGRVLKPGGTALIQMPNVYGLRCLMHQIKRGFREGQGFEVRYWTIGELKRAFESAIGPSSICIDCFFGLGLQKTDKHLMRALPRAATECSEVLKSVAKLITPLNYIADSLYVKATKPT